MNNETLKTLDQAEELYKKVNNTSHGGVYYDADSILAEYITDVPMGMFLELSHTYRTCDDKGLFENFFELLTGISFQEFLERCVNETRLLVLPKGAKIKIPNSDLNLPINPQERVWVITNASGHATAPVSATQETAEDSGNVDEQEPPVIDSFRGEYDFLSNFFPCPVTYNNKSYVCAEAAFQAQKCPERADEFTTLTASKAKRLGRQVTITTQDWDTQRVPIMSEIIWEKFVGNPQLTEKLLETGNAELVEGNTWGDKFWGVVNGEGENQLGKILMATRDKLRLLQSVM